MDAWRRFSALARVCAPIVLITGVMRAWQNLGAIGDLWTSIWGRTLLWKVVLVAVAAGIGLINWRRILPSALANGQPTSMLRRMAWLEVGFAIAVLALTGWLAGLPREGG